MSTDLPFMKFFPGDYLRDPAVRSCSLTARGLWTDMLCFMHLSPRRGYLQQNGKPVSAEQIARMSGCSTDDASRLLQELEDAGVFSRTEHGTIYSRRMVAEETKRQKCSEAGKAGGGNPTFGGDPKGGSKGQSKGASKRLAKPQRSEGREQITPPNPPAGGAGIEFPAGLRTEPFAAAWREWEQHRREKRAKLGATTVQRQLALLASVGHDRAIACIQRSIEQGYTGLFPDSIPANAKPRNDSRVRVLDQNATDALQWLQGQSHQVREQIVRHYRTTSGGSTASTEDILKVMAPRLVAIVNEYRQKGAA